MSKMILGQKYQVKRLNGQRITFQFWGDMNNVNDACEIIESNTTELPVGKLISLDELLATPYVQMDKIFL